MTEVNGKSKNLTYETATGEIEFTLMSDMMFHYVMQKSENALMGLVCALKGITPKDVKKLLVTNPIDLNSTGKETIMDIKLTLNNDEILNIELQVYPDKYWTSRSILYLCRAYDNIGSGEDYSLIKPTTLFCITDQKLLPNATEEFYSKYRLTNLKSHDLYTDKFGINVLQLNHIDIATEEDISNNLVFWAKLFNATTWEEFKALAKDHPDIKEVGNLIFELNYDNRAKDLLEGQRRYREQMNSQYTAGYTDAAEKFEQEISKKDATIADNKATIAARDATIADNKATIAARDATIADNKATIAARDATIADNKATIAARDATIADKNLEIETLKAKLKEYEQSKK